jgi:hypothetical protein
MDCRISCIEIGGGFILFDAGEGSAGERRLNPRMQQKALAARPLVMKSPACFLPPSC